MDGAAAALRGARCIGLEVVGGFFEHVGAPAEEVYAFSAILVEGGCDGETETWYDELAVDVRARGLVG